MDGAAAPAVASTQARRTLFIASQCVVHRRSQNQNLAFSTVYIKYIFIIILLRSYQVVRRSELSMVLRVRATRALATALVIVSLADGADLLTPRLTGRSASTAADDAVHGFLQLSAGVTADTYDADEAKPSAEEVKEAIRERGRNPSPSSDVLAKLQALDEQMPSTLKKLKALDSKHNEEVTRENHRWQQERLQARHDFKEALPGNDGTDGVGRNPNWADPTAFHHTGGMLQGWAPPIPEAAMDGPVGDKPLHIAYLQESAAESGPDIQLGKKIRTTVGAAEYASKQVGKGLDVGKEMLTDAAIASSGAVKELTQGSSAPDEGRQDPKDPCEGVHKAGWQLNICMLSLQQKREMDLIKNKHIGQNEYWDSSLKMMNNVEKGFQPDPIASRNAGFNAQSTFPSSFDAFPSQFGSGMPMAPIAKPY